MLSTKLSDIANHGAKAKRLDVSLKTLEKKHFVINRWTTLTSDYMKENDNYLLKQSKNTLSLLHSRVSERLMLLAAKKRYAVGSAIAERLSRQINKLNAEIRNLVGLFNATNMELKPAYTPISYENALKLDASIYTDVVGVAVRVTPGVPEHIKRLCVQYYLRKLRGLEELSLVEREIQNIQEYWSKQVEVLEQAYETVEGGLKVLVYRQLVFVKSFFQKLRNMLTLSIVREDSELFTDELSEEEDISDGSVQEDPLSEDEYSFYL